MGFSFSEKYNKGSKFDIDTTGFEYKKLKDLYDENGADAVYGLYAIFINTNDKFGDAPVFATADEYVNIPRYMLETCREILNDPEAIKNINAGNVGFKVTEYYNEKYNKDCYGVQFIDADK